MDIGAPGRTRTCNLLFRRWRSSLGQRRLYRRHEVGFQRWCDRDRSLRLLGVLISSYEATDVVTITAVNVGRVPVTTTSVGMMAATGKCGA